MKRKSFALRAQSGLAGLLMAALMLWLSTVGVGSASAQRNAPVAHRGPAARAEAAPAGLLTLGSGYSRVGGSRQVRELQRRLRALDQSPGPVDGLYGPSTEAAVVRFQQQHGLKSDGLVGPQTQRALSRAGTARVLARGAGYDISGGSRQVRDLQRRLRALGQRPGPVDGLYGPLTEAAVGRFQRQKGLSLDGVAGPQTLARLRSRVTPRVVPHGAGLHSRRPAPISRPASAPAHAPGHGVGLGTVVLALVGLAAILAALAILALRRDDRQRVRRAKTPGMRPPRWNGRRSAIAPSASRWARAAAPPGTGRSEAGESPVVASDGRRELPVLGYVSLSAPQDRDSDAFRAQAAVIDLACERRGFRLIGLVSDRVPENAKDPKRPGLAYARERIETGEAKGLVTSSLEGLGGSVVELGALIGWFLRADARLVALDVQLDTGTERGRVTAGTLMSDTGLEWDELAERTRKGLVVAPATDGRTGRAASNRPELEERIAAMRARGMTFQAIANALNSEGAPTLRGGVAWRAGTVHSVAAGYERRIKGLAANRSSADGSGPNGHVSDSEGVPERDER